MHLTIRNKEGQYINYFLSEDVIQPSPPGQRLINKFFGATPDNPIILPVDIPVSVESEKDFNITLIGSVALLGLALIIASNILKK